MALVKTNVSRGGSPFPEEEDEGQHSCGINWERRVSPRLAVALLFSRHAGPRPFECDRALPLHFTSARKLAAPPVPRRPACGLWRQTQWADHALCHRGRPWRGRHDQSRYNRYHWLTHDKRTGRHQGSTTASRRHPTPEAPRLPGLRAVWSHHSAEAHDEEKLIRHQQQQQQNRPGEHRRGLQAEEGLPEKHLRLADAAV